MSHLVSLTAPIVGSHTVKNYDGFGILGANIPLTGADGGSPAANDGLISTSEYYWRVEAPPSAGVLTIFPDITFTHDGTGVPNGQYPWSYQLYEDGISIGIATVIDTFGPTLANILTTTSQQDNQTLGASVSTIPTANLLVTNSQQVNTVSDAVILITTPASLITAVNSQQLLQSSDVLVLSSAPVIAPANLLDEVRTLRFLSRKGQSKNARVTVIKGTENSFKLQLVRNNYGVLTIIDHTTITSAKLHTDLGQIVADSSLHPEYWDFTNVNYISVKLGLTDLPAGDYICYLIIKDALDSIGLAWDTAISLTVLP